MFQKVGGIPRALFAGGQGDYDLILAVDPSNPDRVFLGGDITLDSPSSGDPSDYNLSLFAGTLTTDGQGGFVFPFDPANDFDASQGPGLETILVPNDPTWIGRGIHPDAHAIAFALTHDGSALDGKSVWIGCDGGVFQSSKGGVLGSFEARNLGLADIELTYLAQHPISDAILFCGCQDNGTVRRVGGPVWSETVEGDGGGVAIDPNRPHQVMRQYHNAVIYTCTDGGISGNWKVLTFPPRTKTAPPGTTPTGEALLQFLRLAERRRSHRFLLADRNRCQERADDAHGLRHEPCVDHGRLGHARGRRCPRASTLTIPTNDLPARRSPRSTPSMVSR